MINFLNKIDKLPDKALDADQTSCEESIDLLYDISELIEKQKIKAERNSAKLFDLKQENERLKKENKKLKQFLKVT